uniref:Uncharacterized protein n=1 Tax=Haemonchus contortus TaxID=6289 RepID=A0A7I4YL53_HAECO
MSSGYLSEKDFHRAMMRHLKPGRCHKCLERLTEISMLEAQRETYIIWGDKLDRMADLEEKRVVAVESEIETLSEAISKLEQIVQAEEAEVKRLEAIQAITSPDYPTHDRSSNGSPTMFNTSSSSETDSL